MNKLIQIFQHCVQGELPGGLSCCNQNQKVPGSNPTRRLAGTRDSNSLQCSQ